MGESHGNRAERVGKAERQTGSFEICPSGVNLKIILSFTLYGVTNPVTEVTNLVTHEESLTMKRAATAQNAGISGSELMLFSSNDRGNTQCAGK